MLNVFIDCDSNEIYTGLGDGTPEEIAEAWQEIVSEYSSLMKNENADYYLDLQSRILALKSHLSFVEYSTFFLTRRYDREIIEKLISIGYPGEYPENNRDAYLKQLSRVVSLSKTHAYTLSELQDEEKRIQKSNSGKKMTEDDYECNILRLSKYQGYRINKFKTSVFEYTHIHNNFIEEIKNSHKNNKPPD